MARPALTARGQWLRIALAIPPLVLIFFLGQGLLDARAWRFDLTPERRYTLSEHGRRVLQDLKTEVRLLAFLRSQDPRNLLIRDLLRQVQVQAPRVRVDIVDVNRSPALAREYGVDSYGALVVESEGRRRVFSNPREEILVAALLQVTRQQRKMVAWVTGHGEGDPQSNDRHTGYATARAFLEQEYYEVVPVSLLSEGDVPVGTSVVVIAGPKKDFLPEEVAALERYLQRPGNALVLLDPLRAPALAAHLKRYGFDLPADVVVDPAARIYGGEYLTMQVRPNEGAHPVPASLEAPPLFSLTRSVGLRPVDGELMGMTLLTTGEQSWATTDTAVLRERVPEFVSGDQRGPLTVGGEVSFLTAPGPGGDRSQGRVVVYGNAEFASNFFIDFLGNKDLFVNTVAWLARDPEVIGHRPSRQLPGMNQFFVSAEQGDRLFWGTAVVQPMLLALIGIALVVRRRRGH